MTIRHSLDLAPRIVRSLSTTGAWSLISAHSRSSSAEGVPIRGSGWKRWRQRGDQAHYVEASGPPEREDHRGRLLQGRNEVQLDEPAQAVEHAPRRAASGAPRLPRVLLGARVPRPVGRGRPRELERPAPLPELRRLPRGRLRPGHGRGLRRGARPRRRRAGARLQAPDAREHGRGDRPLRRAPSRPTPSCPKTSRPVAGGSGRRERRVPQA